MRKFLELFFILSLKNFASFDKEAEWTVPNGTSQTLFLWILKTSNFVISTSPSDLYSKIKKREIQEIEKIKSREVRWPLEIFKTRFPPKCVGKH